MPPHEEGYRRQQEAVFPEADGGLRPEVDNLALLKLRWKSLRSSLFRSW